MRRPMVAGNWKMNGSRHDVELLTAAIKQGAAGQKNLDIVVFPSYVFLQQVEHLLRGSAIAWGGQNLSTEAAGAYTGEVSGAMLKDFGCEYVLVGHSERRQLYHEDSQIVAAKFIAAQKSGLQPILCVGETLDERKQGKTAAVISEQLNAVIKAAGIAAFQTAVIAYEPVWAIGTGVTASPEQAEEVHALIRQQLNALDGKIAKTTRLLYGGSVKPDNAAGLFAQPNIDGGLVGGASLKAEDFLGICASVEADFIL